MSDQPHTVENDAWVGAVVPSHIDRKVWIAVLPDTDTFTGAMQASTSLRKCKAHVESNVGESLLWKRADDGGWDAYTISEADR